MPQQLTLSVRSLHDIPATGQMSAIPKLFHSTKPVYRGADSYVRSEN